MAEWLLSTWDVPVDGHHWIEAEEKNSIGEGRMFPHITAGHPLGGAVLHKDRSLDKVSDHEKVRFNRLMNEQRRRMVKHYSPLEHRELYRDFASVELSQDSILSFADKYGLLKRSVNMFEDGVEIWLTKNLGYITYAESFGDWYSEVFDMHNAVELWDAVKSADSEVLERRITWAADGSVKYKSFDGEKLPEQGPISAPLIAIPGVPNYKDFYASTKIGDNHKAAMYHLQQKANDKLTDGLSSALLWDRKWEKLGLYHVPRDLLSAMWLQFAQEITAQRTSRSCVVCGKYIPVGRYGARGDRLYCSDACSQKAYRERKKAQAKAR